MTGAYSQSILNRLFLRLAKPVPGCLNHVLILYPFVATMQDKVAIPLIVNTNKTVMANWKRKPQERDGSYLFSGQFYSTKGVAFELPMDEILFIYQDVRAFAKQKCGIDYLQVYTDEKGRKLFFIDQLTREMVESGDYRGFIIINLPYNLIVHIIWVNTEFE